MRKIAIFTEGLTEQKISRWLIEHIAGDRNLYIVLEKVLGGRKFPTLYINKQETGQIDSCDFYFQIRDCASDSRVASEIKSQYKTLVEAHFDTIIAVRDVSPDFSKSEIPRLLSTMMKVMPSDPIGPETFL